MANYNPLWPFFLLLMGLVAACITTLWVLHVVVFMFFFPPQSQFLNKYFIQVRLSFAFEFLFASVPALGGLSLAGQ